MRSITEADRLGYQKNSVGNICTVPFVTFLRIRPRIMPFISANWVWLNKSFSIFGKRL